MQGRVGWAEAREAAWLTIRVPCEQLGGGTGQADSGQSDSSRRHTRGRAQGPFVPRVVV